MGADVTTPRLVTRAAARVMSCDATIVVTVSPSSIIDGATVAARSIERLHALERRWSRFRPTSEISGLNAAGGEPRRVSADTVRLVEALVRAWHATDGAFDPTLLGALVELGYAASREDATLRTSLAGDVRPQGRPDAILVDPTAGIVRLPAGTTLDPGGLGKGLAADIVVEEALAAGAAGVLVEIGGDLRVAGTPPEGAAWAIAIEPGLPGQPGRIVDLAAGGVATSSSQLRTWTARGATHHHLIDPATRRSTARDVVACTVIAGSSTWAEAFTKVAFTNGADDALECFEARGLAAAVTTAAGIEHTTRAWTEFCR